MRKEIARGHRGIVYLCNYKGKKAVRKEEKEGSSAINRIQNEVFWLKRLNKYKIGPKFYFSRENYFICKFIEGERIIDFLKYSKKPNKIILNILKQCRVMDKLNVDKKEMRNPYKHIIVKNDKAVLIDFERAKYSLKPQNVTAFFAFLTSNKINDILKNKKIKIEKEKLTDLLKKYKKDYSEKNFTQLIKMIKIY
jgi:predicted Ser/Thr protein kinase